MDSTVVCSNCKTVNPISNLFCQTCGARLDGPKASAVTPPPPIPTAVVPPPMKTVPAAVPPVPAAVPTVVPFPPPPPGPLAQSFGRLGFKVDEYSDIVIDSANKSDKVNSEFVKSMQAKQIPQVSIGKSDFTAGGKEANLPYDYFCIRCDPASQHPALWKRSTTGLGNVCKTDYTLVDPGNHRRRCPHPANFFCSTRWLGIWDRFRVCFLLDNALHHPIDSESRSAAFR